MIPEASVVCSIYCIAGLAGFTADAATPYTAHILSRVGYSEIQESYGIFNSYTTLYRLKWE